MEKYVISSIKKYTGSTDSSQIMKILMDPINYLKGLKKSGHFSVLTWFISVEEQLEEYYKYIYYLMYQAYIFYYEYPNILPNTLYRSVSITEYNELKNKNSINGLYSTTKDFSSCLEYTKDVASSDHKNPVQHLIIEFSLYDKVPFIDVDYLKCGIFEPQEIILMPKFNITDVDVIKRDFFSKNDRYHNTSFNVCSAKLSYVENNKEASYEILRELYNEISLSFPRFSELIKQYLMSSSDIDIFLFPEYIAWETNIKNFILYLEASAREQAKNARDKVKKYMY